jgi:hypothetical protein
MPASLGEIISTTRHRLLGVGSYSDRSTELAQELDEGSPQIVVEEIPGGKTGGVVEIGLEKIRIKRADDATNTLTAFSFGRGYDASLQSSHAQGSEVVFAPLIPAMTIAREINSVLDSLYPTLYAVRTLDAVYTHTPESPFVLPDEAIDVVAVFRSDTHGNGWSRVDEWRFEPDSGQGFIAAIPSGRDIRVVYATRIGRFDLSDPNIVDADFAIATGLEDRVSNLLGMGVAARLAAYYDVGKLGSTGPEARVDGGGKSAGAGLQVADRFYQEFQASLEQEAAVLHKQHPIRIHREKVGGRWTW